MVYFAYGNQSFMLKNRTKKIIGEVFKDEEQNVVKIDYAEQGVEAIIDEAMQLSLSFAKKLIIVENSVFLNGEKKTALKNDQLDELMRCLEEITNDPEEMTSILFTLNEDKADDKSKLYKFISTHGGVFVLTELTEKDWPIYVFKYFDKRGYVISNDAIKELVTRVHGDVNIFSNEANKLLMYCEDKKIDLEDVLEIVPRNLEDDSFKILNALLTNNKNEALQIYRDLRLKNIEPVQLISLFSSSILYMLNVKNLTMQNIKNDEIAQITKSSTGRVYMTQKNIKNVKKEFLEAKIEELYNLDKDIKHSNVDRFYAFELYLTNF